MHNRLIFYLSKSRPKNAIPGKNLSKVVKFQNLMEKCCKVRKIFPCEVREFSHYCVTCRSCYHFWAESGKNFRT